MVDETEGQMATFLLALFYIAITPIVIIVKLLKKL